MKRRPRPGAIKHSGDGGDGRVVGRVEEDDGM
jgi:hypothetical protein